MKILNNYSSPYAGYNAQVKTQKDFRGGVKPACREGFQDDAQDYFVKYSSANNVSFGDIHSKINEKIPRDIEAEIKRLKITQEKVDSDTWRLASLLDSNTNLDVPTGFDSKEASVRSHYNNRSNFLLNIEDKIFRLIEKLASFTK